MVMYTSSIKIQKVSRGILGRKRGKILAHEVKARTMEKNTKAEKIQSWFRRRSEISNRLKDAQAEQAAKRLQGNIRRYVSRRNGQRKVVASQVHRLYLGYSARKRVVGLKSKHLQTLIENNGIADTGVVDNVVTVDTGLASSLVVHLNQHVFDAITSSHHLGMETLYQTIFSSTTLSKLLDSELVHDNEWSFVPSVFLFTHQGVATFIGTVVNRDAIHPVYIQLLESDLMSVFEWQSAQEYAILEFQSRRALIHLPSMASYAKQSENDAYTDPTGALLVPDSPSITQEDSEGVLMKQRAEAAETIQVRYIRSTCFTLCTF
jgi:hypothetical protein